jgi:AcrR family transcriptional regulator
MAAASQLICKEGVAGLSTRKLGERLGVEAMSIYHHFPSKGHLLDALVDEAIASIEWPPADLPPLEQVRGLAHAFRAMAHRHAALFPYLAVHRLNTQTGVRFIERVLAQVRAVADDDARAARHFRGIGYFLIGAGLDETAGYAKGPSAMEPVEAAFISRECPHLAAAAPYFQRSHWDSTFHQGLEALLEALRDDAVAPT